jgi:tRNA-Thr(GGU) m(6)t(6)A37 methyltransferase TsaA
LILNYTINSFAAIRDRAPRYIACTDTVAGIRRDVLRVHPRDDRRRPLAGVFATRSPDRPDPLGLHAVTLRRVAGRRLRIGPIEAIDGTPVVDIKPVLRAAER